MKAIGFDRRWQAFGHLGTETLTDRSEALFGELSQTQAEMLATTGQFALGKRRLALASAMANPGKHICASAESSLSLTYSGDVPGKAETLPTKSGVLPAKSGVVPAKSSISRSFNGSSLFPVGSEPPPKAYGQSDNTAALEAKGWRAIDTEAFERALIALERKRPN